MVLTDFLVVGFVVKSIVNCLKFVYNTLFVMPYHIFSERFEGILG